MVSTITPFAVLALFGVLALFIQAKMILRLARLLDKAQEQLKEASDRSYNYAMSNLPMGKADLPGFIPWGDGSGAGFYKQYDGSYIPIGPDGNRLPSPWDRPERGRVTVSENEGDGLEVSQEA